MFNIEYAHSPVFINEDGSCIFMMVKFFEFNEELPFNATSYDSEPHGVDLYNRAKAEEFGTVAECPWPDVSTNNSQPISQGTQQA